MDVGSSACRWEMATSAENSISPSETAHDNDLVKAKPHNYQKLSFKKELLWLINLGHPDWQT